MRQQVHCEQRYGEPNAGGGTLFWLQDPILIPNNDFQISCSVSSVSIPLTNWTITEANRTLHIQFPLVPGGAEDLVLYLPEGNYSIDDIAALLNQQMLYGYQIAYDEHTNSLRLSGGSTRLVVGPRTTCGEILGLRSGQTSAAGELVGADGVDLSGSAHFYISSNIRTRNRDPVTLGYSRILAKIPITRAHNGLERFSAPGFEFGIWDRHINQIVLEILDDDMQPVVFHGGQWSVTLEFDLVPRQDYPDRRDYRDVLGIRHNPYELENGPVGKGKDAPPDKRPDPTDGGQQRGVRGDTTSGRADGLAVQ